MFGWKKINHGVTEKRDHDIYNTSGQTARHGGIVWEAAQAVGKIIVVSESGIHLYQEGKKYQYCQI